MGFNFAFLCDLLSNLEHNRSSKALPLPNVTRVTSNLEIINKWFTQHDRCINEPTTDRLALLSCMFPERRPDRVYWLQGTSLARVIGRCLRLGSSRLAQLDQWKKPEAPDLGQCVENVMSQAENHVQPGREVTVEEIDAVLGMLASRCRFSGPQVRRVHTPVDVDETLSPIYRRLSSRDAKWLTRLILKSYPVALPSRYTLERFHFLLPHLLQFQDTFAGALEMLSSKPMNRFPPNPDFKTAARLCAEAREHLSPRTGVKVGRPEYFKARSIKNCLQMIEGRRMSIERKYDGEYCQIHIDLAQSQANPIQVFSKSGKDSTADRSDIAPILENTLHLNNTKCKFTRRCILEAELVVWSDKRGSISDFHKLRKFIARSGTLLGVDNDSPPQPYEHLMLVFFDILLLDDDICLRKPHRERRLILQDLIQAIPGRSAISEQQVMKFDRIDSYELLDFAFSKAIVQRWEGLVLKACDEPYFPIRPPDACKYFGRWIKLKKDYIPGLGDTIDLTVIGAYYNPRDTHTISPQKPLKWTHFLVGCLLNKEDVIASNDKPRFRVLGALSHHCMHRDFMHTLNQLGEFQAQHPDEFFQFSIEYGHSNIQKASVVFKKPFSVEIMGAGFEKPSGARYYTLRFPRLLKIHMDRTFEDSASFQELQILADQARSVPEEDQLEEQAYWRKRLKVGSGHAQYIERSETPSRGSNSETGGSPCSKDSNETASDESGCEDLPGPNHPTGSHEVATFLNGHKRKRGSKVYVDESADFEPLSGRILMDRTALTEITNLSQTHKQARREPWGGTSTKPIILDDELMEAPTNVEKSTQSSGHCEIEAHLPPTESTGLPIAYVGETRPLMSPLTTIPMSKLASRSENRAFLQSLISDRSKRLLHRSNPLAASLGMVLGIRFVDIAEVCLGQEIHMMAKAALQLIKEAPLCFPSKGTIFFFNRNFFEDCDSPEDLNFCLRDSWSRLATECYYGCLQWDGLDLLTKQPRAEMSSHFGKPSGLFSVSFDDSQVLALGEYASLNPLVHVTSKDLDQ